jgi:hypothetical protein
MQPMQPAPQPQPGAPAQPNHGIADMAARIPHSKPGTLFGIPFSVMHDQSFLNKLLGFSAIGIAGSRFIPVSFSPFRFIWSGNAGNLLIMPMILAGVYFLVALAPKDLQAKIPAPVLKWGPFFAAYIGTGMLGVASPMMMMMSLGGGPALGGGALAYTYPILVFGMLIRIQDEDDIIARYFVGVAALSSLFSALGMFSWLFHFGGVPFMFIINNIITLVALLLMASCLLFAIPKKWVPAVAQFEGFAQLATALLAIYPLVSLVIVMLGLIVHMHMVIGALMVGAQFLVMFIGFFGVLILSAPAAYGVIKGWLGKVGVNTSVAAAPVPGAGVAAPAPAGNPMDPAVIQQRLAQLDADWQRGGMTPEMYQQRRAAIMAGQP